MKAKTEPAVEVIPFEVTEGRVLVRYAKRVKESGIMLPNEDLTIEGVGHIVGISGRPTRARVGCKIAFNRHAAVPVNVNGEEFLVLNEDGILGYYTN